MTGARTTASRSAHFLSRVGVVVRLWLGGGLTTRQVVRLAMRVSRFGRWGVRPITQARFAALVAAAAAPPPEPPPESADMRRQLDMAAARLRQVEAEHQAAAQAAADVREALDDTRALAGRNEARALQMLHLLEAATLKIRHLEEIAAAYGRVVDRDDADGGEAVRTERFAAAAPDRTAGGSAAAGRC